MIKKALSTSGVKTKTTTSAAILGPFASIWKKALMTQGAY